MSLGQRTKTDRQTDRQTDLDIDLRLFRAHSSKSYREAADAIYNEMHAKVPALKIVPIRQVLLSFRQVSWSFNGK